MERSQREGRDRKKGEEMGMMAKVREVGNEIRAEMRNLNKNSEKDYVVVCGGVPQVYRAV